MKHIKHWSVWDWIFAGIAFGVTLIAIGEAFAADDWSKSNACFLLTSVNWRGVERSVVLNREGTSILQEYIFNKVGEAPFKTDNSLLAVTVLQEKFNESGRPAYFFVEEKTGCTYGRYVLVDKETRKVAESLFEDFTAGEMVFEGGEDT